MLTHFGLLDTFSLLKRRNVCIDSAITTFNSRYDSAITTFNSRYDQIFHVNLANSYVFFFTPLNRLYSEFD